MAFGGPFFGQAAGRTFERFRKEDRENRGLDIQQQNADTTLSQHKLAERMRLQEQISDLTKRFVEVSLFRKTKVGDQQPQSTLDPFLERTNNLINQLQQRAVELGGVPQQFDPAGAIAAGLAQRMAKAQQEGAIQKAKTVATKTAIPTSTNYVNPKTGKTRAVNEAVPDEILAAGDADFVRAPTSIQAGKAADFDLQGPEIKEYSKFQSAALAGVVEVERMLGQLEDDQVFTGIMSGAIRAGDSLAQFFTQASNALGGVGEITLADGSTKVVSNARLLDPSLYDFDQFGAAGKSAAFKSNMVNLAYSIARALDPGGRLSDKDVELQINALSGRSNSKSQIKASLGQARARMIAGVQAKRDVFRLRNPKIDEVTHPLFRDDLPSGKGPAARGARKTGTKESPARIRTWAEFDALPKGAIFIDGSGTPKVK